MQWFERKFDVLNPNHSFPGIIERLKGTTYRLRGMLEAIDHAHLKSQFDGTWSIKENIGHLSDLEPLWLGRVGDLMAHEEVLRSADLENRKTHDAAHNQADVNNLLNGFMGQRVVLVTALAGMSKDLQSVTAKHPRLGTPMRAVDLAYFVAEHDDHHLATITRLCDEHNLWLSTTP